MKTCPKCQTQHDDNFTECSKCNVPLIVPKQRVCPKCKTIYDGIETCPQCDIPTSVYNVYHSKKRKQEIKPVLTGILILMAMIAVIFGAIMVYQRMNTNDLLGTWITGGGYNDNNFYITFNGKDAFTQGRFIYGDRDTWQMRTYGRTITGTYSFKYDNQITFSRPLQYGQRLILYTAEETLPFSRSKDGKSIIIDGLEYRKTNKDIEIYIR